MGRKGKREEKERKLTKMKETIKEKEKNGT